MAVPTTTQWPLDPHTRAKHTILRNYLQAWFPILGMSHPRVVFVDGFCGPGRYSSGEIGSPLIALEVATGFAGRLPAEVVFFFTEKDPDRAAHLRKEVAALTLPSSFKVDIEEGRFDEVFGRLLRGIERLGSALAPTFAFIDPFGFSGVPFALVERILRFKSCEVLLTFMINSIQRFLGHPDAIVRTEMESLFGISDIEAAIARQPDRGEALRGLYQRQLASRAKFVRSFEIRDTPGHVMYHLFFASNNALGHRRMKDAMWKADPSGSFRFADNTDPSQLVLLNEDPAERLALSLYRKYVGEQVLAERLKEYVLDETAFREPHATAALRKLEKDGAIEVMDTKMSGDKRKKGTFASGTTFTFKRAE